jgi:hypothetical protein
VGQDGSRGIQVFTRRPTLSIQWTKTAVNLQAGTIDGVAARIQKVLAMPEGPISRLDYRQIKQGFSNIITVGMQTPADKSTGGENDGPRSNPAFFLCIADIQCKKAFFVTTNIQDLFIKDQIGPF